MLYLECFHNKGIDILRELTSLFTSTTAIALLTVTLGGCASAPPLNDDKPADDSEHVVNTEEIEVPEGCVLLRKGQGIGNFKIDKATISCPLKYKFG